MSITTEDQESEILKSLSKISNKSAQKCDHKCVQHGDRICYGDARPQETVKRIPDVSQSAESIDDDSLHSGESMFKTFSFETQDPDPDMEKCIAFWKTILGKNAKPIRCSLVNPKKGKAVKKKNFNKETIGKSEKEQNQWLEIYKDLQRRHLDKIKLVKSKRCDPCADYIDEEEVKKQDEKEIRQLNAWKSEQSQNKPVKIDIQSQVKRTLQVLQAARTSSQARTEKKKTPQAPQVSSLTKSEEKSKLQSKPSLSKEKSAIVTITKEEKLSGSNVTTVGRVPPTPTDSSVTAKSESIISTIQGSESRIITLAALEAKLAPSGGETCCCKCGCDCDECICEEMEDYLVTDFQEQDQSPCYPCDCSSECVCDSHPATKICPCGCGVEDCQCDAFQTCRCKEAEEKECECGCGPDECICEKLFTESCQCGLEECDCGMVEVLNAYLESVGSPSCVSTGAQTEEENLQLETTQREGAYCIICGHYNCYCTEKIKTQ